MPAIVPVEPLEPALGPFSSVEDEQAANERSARNDKERKQDGFMIFSNPGHFERN